MDKRKLIGNTRRGDELVTFNWEGQENGPHFEHTKYALPKGFEPLELLKRYNAYAEHVGAIAEAEEALQGMRDYMDGEKGELANPLGAMDEALERLRAIMTAAKDFENLLKS